VTATIIYAIILYSIGLFGTTFDKVTKIQKGVIILLLTLIILITVPFSFKFFGEFLSSNKLIKVVEALDFDRIDKLWVLTITAISFLLIDIIMEKAEGDDKIKFHINRKYSETPVIISFTVLLLYAYFIGLDNIEKYNLEPFFAGTIAFHMISSNIIWVLNDDKFWDSLKTIKV